MCVNAMWLLAVANGAVHAADAPEARVVVPPVIRGTPPTTIKPPADPPGRLPGEFIIRTFVANTPLTAHDAAVNEPDAVVTTATPIGPNQQFKLNAIPAYTTIQTLDGRYLTASGDIRPGNGDPRMALQTYDKLGVGTSHFKFYLAPELPHGHINIARKWPGVFTIRTSSSLFLTAVAGGGQASAAFHTDAQKPGTWERYWVLKCGDLGSGYSYAIRPAGTGPAERGAPPLPEQSWLLAHVGDQWSMHVYFAFYPTYFKFMRQSDGSYALAMPLRTGTHYVTAVGGGGLSSGDNLHTDATQVQAWERFRIVDQGDCTYTIQTVDNWFLAIGPNDVKSTRISDPAAAPSIGYNARFELVMTNVWQGSQP